MSLTSDPKDPRLGHGIDREPRDQHNVYLVLSDEERAKGFVRPVYRAYIHHDPACGVATRMGLALCETYARDPSFYGAIYCCGCRLHRPVGREGEFTWLDEAGNDTHILVGTLLCRCGHDRQAHEHYRRGADCSLCECPRYQRRRLRQGILRK